MNKGSISFYFFTDLLNQLAPFSPDKQKEILKQFSMKYIKKGDQHFFNTYYVLGTSLKNHKTLHNLHNHLRKKIRLKVFFLTTSRATVQQCSKADAFTTIEHNRPQRLIWIYSARQHFLLPWKRGNPGLFSPPSWTISSHRFSSSRLDIALRLCLYWFVTAVQLTPTAKQMLQGKWHGKGTKELLAS